MKGALLSSFLLGGFESATGVNCRGELIDQVVATQHDVFLEEDYKRLKEVGIRAAREAIRWPVVDVKGRYDFSTVRPMLEAATQQGVDIIYDLFHFGFPADVDLLSAGFPDRFADYCHAVARLIADSVEGPCYFTPINEPSFFSWAGGEVGLFAPHLKNRGFDLKVSLIRAAIKGITAIWDACPRARIVNVDPFCRVVSSADRDDEDDTVNQFNSKAVFQGWDMLCGKMLPELGGTPRHLDLVGVNYYWTNQWELGNPGVPLSDRDPRRWSLHRLLKSVWQRYGAELILTETAHVDEMRPIWFRELIAEVQAVLADQIPLRGVCLYPILGMPEWHDQTKWTQMGVWDLVLEGSILKRVPYEPLIESLCSAQKYFIEMENSRPSARRATA